MHEITIAHYQAPRDEILARMGMRETILTVYLGFVGAVFGLAVAEHPIASVALVIPFIAFALTWIFRDHELALANLGRWLIEDYTPYIQNMFQEAPPPHWDNSLARKVYNDEVIVSRYVTHSFAFVGSSVVAGFIAWGADINQISLIVWTVIASGMTIWTMLVIRSTWRKRQQYPTPVHTEVRVKESQPLPRQTA